MEVLLVQECLTDHVLNYRLEGKLLSFTFALFSLLLLYFLLFLFQPLLVFKVEIVILLLRGTP